MTTRCRVCNTGYTSLDCLPLACSPSVPSGISIECGMIAVWRRCPCGEVLVELFRQSDGQRIDTGDDPVEVRA